MSNAFFDHATNVPNSPMEVSCCSPDNNLVNVTCNDEDSCEGACSYIGASLCLSGNCTGDPADCEYCLRKDEDGNWAPVTRPPGDFSWCQPMCRVGQNPGCCFNPECYQKRQELCSWLDYFTGKRWSNGPYINANRVGGSLQMMTICGGGPHGYVF